MFRDVVCGLAYVSFAGVRLSIFILSLVVYYRYCSLRFCVVARSNSPLVYGL